MPDRLPDENDSLIAGIPLPILEGLREYGLHHAPVGGFLHAVLCNNLVEAVCRADEGGLAAIRQIVLYVYNAMPSTCWGSREKVAAWLKLRTIAEAAEIEEGGKIAVAVPPKKMASSTDDRTADRRVKKSS
jgi:hypothetical protein